MAAAAITLPQIDPARAAEDAGLRYVGDEEPGITRERRGSGFSYRHPDGALVKDKATLARIKRLAIPPAWADVWICRDASGHIQATGRDARGRKQYRYHHDWRRVRDETKFERTMAFAQALPRIRAQVRRDLARKGLPREKVLATIVSLLETTFMRVGNEEYARQNGSYGLTTLRDSHARVQGGTLVFTFAGKHGKRHRIEVDDARLARIVKRCRDVPGQVLFQYVDDDGEERAVGSADVNAYLREISGEDFTAKDFRTWAGTVLAALALRELEAADTQAAIKRNVNAAIESVAQRLGNTPAVCRKCYVHPAVIESYLDGDFAKAIGRQVERARVQEDALRADEAAVLRLLKARVAKARREGDLEGQLRRSLRRAARRKR